MADSTTPFPPRSPLRLGAGPLDPNLCEEAGDGALGPCPRDMQMHANHWLTLPPILSHETPDPDDCDHDFQGWRDFPDGLGGELVCAKCGIGGMAYSLRTGL